MNCKIRGNSSASKIAFQIGLLSILFGGGPVWSQTPSVAPDFTFEWGDAVTGGNSFTEGGKTHWYVDAGADQYAIDQWERPTNQTYKFWSGAGLYGTDGDYFANLDIVRGLSGFDENFVYFGIDLYDNALYKNDNPITIDQEGLKYDYRVRLSLEENGNNGWLLSTDDPENKVGTTWGQSGVKGFRNTNGDFAVNGNGYNSEFISDGEITQTPYAGAPNLNGEDTLWARVSPLDDTIVEFALKYANLGLTADDLKTLPYLVFEANKGTKDPANYIWNQEYTGSQAGSPNYGGSGDDNEFGSQGLGNVYELDTLRLTGPDAHMPEPSTASMLLAGLASLLLVRRRAA